MPQKSIHVNELLTRAVADYQAAHGISSWSAAAVELIARGFQEWHGGRWGGGVDAEQQLRDEYRDWLREKTASHTDVDPLAVQDGDYTFERFIVQSIAPKWGGKRK